MWHVKLHARHDILMCTVTQLRGNTDEDLKHRDQGRIDGWKEGGGGGVKFQPMQR